jgi:hypothetical protein
MVHYFGLAYTELRLSSAILGPSLVRRNPSSGESSDDVCNIFVTKATSDAGCCCCCCCLEERSTTIVARTSTITGMTSDTFTQELQAVFGGWTEKWNSGDLEGYLEAYQDSDQTRYCAGSKVIRGKENIAAHYREQGAYGHLSVVDFEAQAMGDNLNDGLVFGQFELVLEDETRHPGAFTVHVRKINGLWRILSDHSAAF